MPVGASGAKPQPSYSFNQPGQLFSVQPKVESSPSSSAATSSQTWRIMESLNLGPQSKATAVPSFPGVQTQASSSAAASSSNTTAALNQDYSTVNLSDLHEFFPNISSAMAQEAASSQGNAASSQASSAFTLQGSQFRVEPAMVEDDMPEFPSFPEPQAPGALDSIDMGDFEDLLNPALIADCGNGASMLSQVSCQQVVAPSSSGAAHNGGAAAAAHSSSDPTGNPGSTWMNYPNSIVSLLQNEAMIEPLPHNNHRPPVLDEFDELMSADEDRLISIFNNAGQARFVPGHPT